MARHQRGAVETMDTFRWMSSVFSMILGLGVARILASAVAVLRARRRASLDWLPLAWAGFIFVQQLTLWWSLEDLANLSSHWTYFQFLILVALVLTLFVAAASVLPPSEIAKDESLRLFFEQDGRFGLIALAAFNLTALAINHIFWSSTSTSAGDGLNLLLTVLPLLGFFGTRRVQVAVTLLYLPTIATAVLLLSPNSY